MTNERQERPEASEQQQGAQAMEDLPLEADEAENVTGGALRPPVAGPDKPG